LKTEEKNYKMIYIVNDYYEKLIEKQNFKSKRKMSLEELKKRLEKNDENGYKAEAFVLEYEKKRLKLIGDNRYIKQISEIDVTAGYDILSFKNILSSKYDMFIEVKSVGQNNSFFWSSNEIEVAKIKGERYYLYLVNLNQINDINYIPTIIENPYNNVYNSNQWFKKVQSFEFIQI